MFILLTWLHLLAAFAWIGGMLFLTLVLVPLLKQEPFAAQRGPLFRALGLRFRLVVWTAVSVLVTTGPLLLILRGVDLGNPAGWPGVLTGKLLLVALLIGLTAAHDFWLGPRAAARMRGADPGGSPLLEGLLRVAPWIARLGLGLALVVLLLAVALARS
jgi:putative copper resistance protein D